MGHSDYFIETIKKDTETPRRKLHKSKGKIGYGCYDEYRVHSLLHVIAWSDMDLEGSTASDAQ